MIEQDKKTSEEVITNIQKTIKEEIAPMLRGDGGDIEFVGFENGIVKVKLQGACVGCPMASFTLKNMVEAILKDNVPEVLKVEEFREIKEESIIEGD